MRKIATTLFLIMVFTNAAPLLFDQAGLSDTLDIDASASASSEIEDKRDRADDRPGAGESETLFGLYDSATSSYTAIVTGLFPAADLMVNNGVPDFWVNFLFSGMTFIIGFATYSAVRGVDL